MTHTYQILLATIIDGAEVDGNAYVLSAESPAEAISDAFALAAAATDDEAATFAVMTWTSKAATTPVLAA